MLITPEYLKNIPSIAEVIKLYKLQPNKKLGQNFLLDSYITDQIVSACGNLRDKAVLEIGPGPGGLMRSILSSDIRKLYAVEMDKRCIEHLRIIEALSGGKLKVIEADATELDEHMLAEDKLVIIANLPYNIGTRLLLKWLGSIQLYECIVIMLQKEVVDRITASPSSKDYGRLSVLTQLYCDVDKIMDVDPNYFFPPPKVFSSVVRLIPRQSAKYNFNQIKLYKILEYGFSQRRKMIRSSLAAVCTVEDIRKAGIDETRRIEDLTIEQLCKLSLV